MEWGKSMTECPRCGNRDINKILVWFLVAYPGEKKLAADAAPMPTFFYERRPGTKPTHVALAFDKLTCLKCAEEGRGEVEIVPKPSGPYQP